MTMFGSQWFANTGGAGYTIDQSIRFNDGDSPYLNRTFGTPTSNSQFGYSFWIKLGEGYDGKYIISANGSGNNDNFYFSSNKINIQEGGVLRLQSNQLFRDFSSWYHFVVAYDLGNATASQKLRVYLNGSEITSWATDTRSSLSSTSSRLNAAVGHDVGANVFNGVSSHINNWDGYIAEFHFVDGTVLTPTDFGEYNSDGVWIPIEASPTYGNNGFYITGETASDLGEDFSGNNNDFTSSGLATTDQMLDTPTDNYSIFNPVASCNVSGQPLTISDGNLRTSAGGTSNAIEAITQIGPSSGKWYAEFTLNAAPQLSNQYPVIGVIAADLNITGGNNVGDSTFRGYVPNGNIQGTGGGAYGDTFTTNDIIGCAIDLDNQKIWWSKNGVFQNSGDPAAGTNAAFTNLTAGLFYRFCISHAGSTATDVTGNFGQSAFTYTPPTDFNALSTAALDDPIIADPSAHFQTTVYTGNGTAIGSGGLEVNQSGNSTFQPDFAWIKNRTTGGNEHDLYDAVRGATKVIFSSTVGAEATVTEGLVSFDSDGFTVGNRGEVNTSGNSMVAWQWKANGSGSSNTDGSITSTVSTNNTSNFSIVTYVGNSTSGATVGHGLGAVPKMMILKDRDVGENWCIYHEELGPTKFMYFTTDGAFTVSNRWNDTAPTSSVFTLGNETQVNATGRDYVVYCFAEVENFSSVGGYTGNGSTDGPFVYTNGFAPAFVMTKRTNAAGDWKMWDNKRGPYNVNGLTLAANSSGAESSGVAQHIDFLSNGFKIRGNDTETNGSGSTYIFMAVAESPFKTATAR